MNFNNVEAESSQEVKLKRNHILPIWIRVFTWFFALLALMVPVALVYGMLGLPFKLELYGVATHAPFSLTGIAILLLIAMKGVVAFGFILNRVWSVALGRVDAFIGIGFCLAMMIMPLFELFYGRITFELRLELLVLIPYLLVMKRIKKDWESIEVSS